MTETLKELFDRLDREGKEICDFDRVVGRDPLTGEGVEWIIIKTCRVKKI